MLFFEDKPLHNIVFVKLNNLKRVVKKTNSLSQQCVKSDIDLFYLRIDFYVVDETQ